ncbi:MAG: AzlC family ABC transporter permease [Oscillospiraceae bacterium]|nr:AzlC family ABC transporter permease [Oscillospiraceae bacterium]
MKQTFLYAFRRTVPILLGFFPLGIAYGVLMESIGYNFLWSSLTSLTVLAGSLQFLMVEFFTAGTPLITVVLLALLLNSRHIFYGLSFVEKFRSFGKGSRLFLIYSLSDESYSLHCACKPQEGVNEKWAHLFSAGFVVFYWVLFTFLGGLVGKLITFDTTGIDFSLTALFVVILIDQMQGAKTKLPAAVAVVSGIVCILIFGAANFILPSLILTVAVLCLLRSRLEPYTVEEEVAA